MQDTNYRCGDSDVYANHQFYGDVAPDFGIHSEGIHEENEAAYKKPGTEENRADIHAVRLP